MNFRDMELDFDIFDADTVDDYEAELKKAKERFTDKQPGETTGDAIRRQCYAVFDFFDELIEPDFHKIIFGERTNLILCLEAFQEFVDEVDKQKAKIVELTDKAQAKNTEKAAAMGNRAARRGGSRAAPKATTKTAAAKTE